MAPAACESVTVAVALVVALSVLVPETVAFAAAVSVTVAFAALVPVEVGSSVAVVSTQVHVVTSGSWPKGQVPAEKYRIRHKKPNRCRNAYGLRKASMGYWATRIILDQHHQVGHSQLQPTQDSAVLFDNTPWKVPRQGCSLHSEGAGDRLWRLRSTRRNCLHLPSSRTQSWHQRYPVVRKDRRLPGAH